MADRSTPRPTSLLLLLATYLGMLIGGIILFYLLVYAAEAFLGLAFPENNAMGLILVVVAGMSTGGYWYNREHAVPSSGRKWALALLIGVATIAVQAGLFWLLMLGGDEFSQMSREIGGEDRWLIIGALVTVAVLQLLLLRAAIWYGIRTAAKRDAQLRAKA